MKLVIDFEVTPRARRAVRWVMLPSLVVLGMMGVAHATLDPKPDDWIKPGSPVSADALKKNLTQLDAAVAAGRFVAVVGGKKYSVGATVFCGRTGTAYDGAGIGGYTGAKAKCESIGGKCSDGAHMCTGEELIRSAQLGVPPTDGGYYSSGVLDDVPTRGLLVQDCSGWTVADADHGGASWNVGATGGGNPSNYVCSGKLPILCCD